MHSQAEWVADTHVRGHKTEMPLEADSKIFPPFCYLGISPTRRITPAGSGTVASTAGWDEYKSVQSQVFKEGRESKKYGWAFQYKLEKTTVIDGCAIVCVMHT